MESKTQLSLYNILDELTTWENTLELATTPEQEQEIQSRIREYLTAGRDKVDRYCQMLAHLDGEIANALRESAWRRLWELYASTSDHIHVVELVSEEPIP
jgi:hypothetical protein